MNIARAGHTTVRLSDGKVLIIAGVTAGGIKTASVELFDPATEVFTQTASLSPNGAGSGQAFNVGNDRIVYIYRGDTDDVEIFRYPTGQWTKSGAAIPSGGLNPAMALLNDGRIFVCGGYSETSDASVYDPVADSWQVLAAMTQGRQNHTATTLPSGTVFIASGLHSIPGQSLGLATTEIYSVNVQPRGTTAAGPALPGVGPKGLGMASALMSTGQVLMTGGGYNPAYGAALGALANGAIYDPIAATITAVGPMNVSRHDHTMTPLLNGLVLIVGGVADQSGANTPVTELFGYGNFPTQPTTFTQTGAMVLPRASAQAVTLNSGQVLITGGGLADGSVTPTAEIYSPSTGTFSLTSNSMTSSRIYHSSSLLPDGRVLIVGGQDGSSPGALSSTDIYDPATNSFTAGPPMTHGHYLNRSLVLTDGRVIVIGGEGTNSVEIFDPTQKMWSLAAPIPSGGGGYAAARVLDGRVFVSGGDVNGNQVVVYDPAANAWTSMAPMLTWRQWHTAATLPNGNVLIAGGDNGASALGSSEIYSPLTMPNGSSVPAGGVAVGTTSIAAASLPNGDVWIAGGDMPIWNGNVYCSSGRTAAQLFNSQSNTWSDLTSMITGRYGLTASLLQSGQILVAGGIQYNCPATSFSIPSTTLASAAELWTGAANSTGTITVNSMPSGAGFTLVGPGLVNISQTTPFTLTDATPGNWMITWDTLVGGSYQTPPGQSQSLSGGATILFNGAYQALTGTINVTTNLSAATFTLTGPVTLSGSGTVFTKSNIPVGTYTLKFHDVPKYIAPPIQKLTLSAGQNLTFGEGVYTPITLSACVLNTTPCVSSLSFTYAQGAINQPVTQQVAVSSNGPAIKFSVRTSPNSSATWLSVSSPSGTTPAEITITVQPNLTANTYKGTITFTSPDSNNGPQALSVTVTVKLPAQPFLLIFPVQTCGGSTCTPDTAPINAVFDHDMHRAYECTPGAGGYGSIMPFTHQIVNGRQSTDGYGRCGKLYGYEYTSGSGTLLAGYNYNVPLNGRTLYYDSHPGYDYNFTYGTPLYPAVNGCVTYLQTAAGVQSAESAHILAIIPQPKEPAGGCQTLTANTGYSIVYMHLSSFYQNNKNSPNFGSVERCTSSRPTDCIAGRDTNLCTTCAQQNEYVTTDRANPIGYTGNFLGKWGGVPGHLHFEVDQIDGTRPVPVDPYGWCGTPSNDPYTAHTGVANLTLWKHFVLTCPSN